MGADRPKHSPVGQVIWSFNYLLSPKLLPVSFPLLMPELPEVELYRREFEQVALHQTIRKIDVENEGRMLPGGLAQLREVAIGHQLVETDRIGKYLFIRLGNQSWLMWHFGLTGSFTYYQDDALRHRFAHIIFTFDHGWKLSFNSMRKFSRLEVIDNVADYQRRKKIGPDAQRISREDFAAALASKTTQIKPALLAQNKFAGIGNWIADEMLHRVKIHPEMRCHQIETSQYHALHDALQDIIQVAIDYGADYEQFPDHFLIRVREDGGHCPRCGRELTRLVVGGRGTYLCDTCQPTPA
jgi:formamidopyrimidine-DNA glycosylase